MKKWGKKSKANSSGQLLIVAALAIALLISSTTIYVYEISEETNSPDTPSISDFTLASKQSTRNAVISSLANVSNGGEKTVLTTNLNSLSQALRNTNQFGICQLAFTPQNDSSYDEGVWLSWNTSDVGVSSAYVNFTLNVYGVTAKVTANYPINITTAIAVNGSYTTLEDGEKLVNLTCKMYNEGEPALAKNMTLFYENLGNWTIVDASNNLSIVEYGNGTYSIAFTVETSSDSVSVSVRVHDLRDIFVQANTTCYTA
jgi:hypothetical protein